jgi:Fe-S oxidoreductase
VSTLHYADLLEAIRSVEHILPHGPSAVEVLDRTVLHMAREQISIRPLMDFLVDDPAAVLIVEFYGETPEEAAAKAARMAEDIKAKGFGFAWPSFTDAASKGNVWKVRRNGLGLMLGLKGERKPVPFIEDAAVPIPVLAEYVGRVLDFCKTLDVPVALYAHASVGLIHIRPILNLKDHQDIEFYKKISRQAFEWVKAYGGSWSSEHGDGLVRSPYVSDYYGPKIYAAFREVKQLFDPSGLMNPGKILDASPMDQNLRYGPAYQAQPLSTLYKYRQDGSFSAAVEMCTGVGDCRKVQEGTMCPSYRATRDEEHSTRGRANALRLAMSGQFGPEGFASERVREVLDLCLSCKGCKSECPSNVDLAKLKSEFLQHYHHRHGLSLRERMIASSADMAPVFSGLLAPVVNKIQETSLFRRLLDSWTGFDHRRIMPRYATRPFHKEFAKRVKTGLSNGKRVVLFDDTYLNYYEPHVGHAAVDLLESCGYSVTLARAGCCQRPRISHGLLKEAKREGERTLRALDVYIRQGLQVVVCEPSCCSALTDDLPDLIEDEELAKRIMENVMMIDVFLEREIEAGRVKNAFTSSEKSLLIHGHCHQKALYGTSAMMSILSRVGGLSVTEVDAGCCGMAGSFGYEKEHYDLSMKIGEDRLVPAIKARPEGTTVVACGFSCRHQIADAAGVKARHWVEVVRGKA